MLFRMLVLDNIIFQTKQIHGNRVIGNREDLISWFFESVESTMLKIDLWWFLIRLALLTLFQQNVRGREKNLRVDTNFFYMEQACFTNYRQCPMNYSIMAADVRIIQ